MSLRLGMMHHGKGRDKDPINQLQILTYPNMLNSVHYSQHKCKHKSKGRARLPGGKDQAQERSTVVKWDLMSHPIYMV